MRTTTRALAVSTVAASALALAAPAATAWTDPVHLAATQKLVPRGGRVTVTVDGTKCQSGATATSDAFGTVRLMNAGGERAGATTTVRGDAGPGAHDITVHCQGTSLTRPGAFTVVHGAVRGGAGGASSPGASPTDMAIGTVLIACALLGSGVFWFRRRSDGAS
ncbi:MULTISPECIES: hypothetical protein [unclassified Streptomyces]|uniref:hypothetical protein n=1 Tax=unclassified Streptomyces TaxID=2593676 RepID=UPI00278C3B97|nr:MULTISPECIES: hypothetical protein [unclassified Streptomyces]